MPCRSRRTDQRQIATPASGASISDVLAEAELEDEIAAGTEAARRLPDQPREEIEAVGAAEQRDRRLVIAHFGLQRRPRAIDHVRRIRDDRVERPVDAVEQIAVPERDAIGDAVPRGVASRDLERRAARCRWR